MASVILRKEVDKTRHGDSDGPGWVLERHESPDRSDHFRYDLRDTTFLQVYESTQELTTLIRFASSL